ncbi:MAG: hypothetical protein GVY32_07870 [Gammaproteobacteria bacterium]|nr:hypothetical protein [Gammaproteobacteria bacterium]
MCSGPCELIIAGNQGSPRASASQSPADRPSGQSLPKVVFDLELSSNLSELDRISSEYPHHAAALLRYEHIEALQGIERSISTQALTSVEMSTEALERRKASGHSLLLDERPIKPENSFMGPLDRWLEVEIIRLAPDRLEVLIRSYRVANDLPDMSFEAQTRILADRRQPESPVYEIASVHTSQTE